MSATPTVPLTKAVLDGLRSELSNAVNQFRLELPERVRDQAHRAASRPRDTALAFAPNPPLTHKAAALADAARRYAADLTATADALDGVRGEFERAEAAYGGGPVVDADRAAGPVPADGC